MPLWIRKLFFVASAAPTFVRDDRDHEWAEFNLPAGCDLRALYSPRIERDEAARNGDCA
jgi:hypothetical protein